LGLNPKRFGGLANHRPEPWKAPLPQFHRRHLCQEVRREGPDVVVPVEEYARQLERRKAARKTAKAARAKQAAQATAEAAPE